MSQIKLTADSGGGTTSLKAPSSTTSNADVVLKLPVADGSSGQVLKTDGSGQLSFTSNAGTTINNNATTKFITGTDNANELDCEANLSYNNSVVTFSSSNLSIDKSTNPTVAVKETAGNKEVQLRANTTGGLLRTAGSYPLVLGTNQTERLRIDSSGRLLVNSTSTSIDSKLISTIGTGTGVTWDQCGLAVTHASGANTKSLIGFGFSGNGGSYPPAAIGSFTNSTSGNENNNLVFFTRSATSDTEATERMRIDTTGHLLVAHSSARNNFFSAVSTEHTPIIQLEGTNQNRAISLTAANQDGGMLILARQNGSVGANTVVSSGDQIGRIEFQGSGGTNMEQAAQITAEVDGTPGDNDMPGRLLFKTTADGSNTPTESMRIHATGVVTMPKQVSCAVRLSSNLSWPGDNSFTTDNGRLEFDTEVWDIGGNFNTSNYTFTAPVAGRYLTNYVIQFENFTGFQWLYMYPVVNDSVSDTTSRGVAFADYGSGSSNSAAATYWAFSNSLIMNLQANDAVKFKVRGTVSSATIKSGSETQWNIHLLG